MNKIKYFPLLIATLSLLGLTNAFGSDVRTSDATKSNEINGTGQTAPPASNSPRTGERIKWQVVSAGGNHGSSTHFALTGTAGQTVVGRGTSTNYGVSQGYWQAFKTYVCGDASGDGSVDISDAVHLIQYIFAGGPAPNPLAAGDANCDLAVDISDAVYVIQYIFSGGPAPCASCK